MSDRFGIKMSEDKKKQTIWGDLYDRFLKKKPEDFTPKQQPIIIQQMPPPPAPKPVRPNRPSPKIEVPMP